MLLVGASCLVATGCSMVKTGYDNLPTLAMWQVGKYVSLDPVQKRLFTSRLESLHDWHRSTQMAEYAQLLRSIQQQVAEGPVDAATVGRWRLELLERFEPLVERAAPAAVEVAATMQPAQLQRMRSEFERSNAKLRREWMPDDPAARIDARTRRFVERAEWFLGDATPSQRRLARETAEALPASNEDLWLAQRIARQQEMLAKIQRIAEERPAPAIAERLVREHLMRYGRIVGAPAAATAASNASDALMAAMLAEATPAQRRHLDRKLQQWIDALEQIAAAGRRPLLARP
jgi:hypothetical protein